MTQTDQLPRVAVRTSDGAPLPLKTALIPPAECPKCQNGEDLPFLANNGFIHLIPDEEHLNLS